MDIWINGKPQFKTGQKVEILKGGCTGLKKGDKAFIVNITKDTIQLGKNMKTFPFSHSITCTDKPEFKLIEEAVIVNGEAYI